MSQKEMLKHNEEIEYAFWLPLHQINFFYTVTHDTCKAQGK